MTRRAQAGRLDLWMNGHPVGHWETARGEEQLAYRHDWIDHPQGRPLSLSLPFLPGNPGHRGPVVAAYFDNLLPDSEPIRRRIAARYQTGGTTPFALLAQLGRDCVGAIQMLPPGEAPQRLETIQGRPLEEAGIAALLRETTTAPLPGGHEPVTDLRLSIAGAQEKTALLRYQDQWLLPEGSTPTTHILKLPLGLVGNMQADMRTSVENEWLCSRIIAAYGLPIAGCDIACFEDRKVLVVERFDRRLSSDGRWILRLPQEDMCQATGTPAFRKYEADGGPGIEKIAEILSGSEQAEPDRHHFLLSQMIFWLLAATDGHAKNFSIAHRAGNRYRATPLYDVLSAHPIIGKGQNLVSPQKAKLAMAVHGSNKHYKIGEILRRHWIEQGKRIGFPTAAVETMIDTLVMRTDRVIDTVSRQIPPDFPMDVADAIFAGLRRQSAKLADPG